MATVVVGCKLPNGIILEKDDKRVVLRGANSATIVGGHGITENVDKEFFDAWMASNKNLDFVRNGFVFAHEKAQSTTAEAKDRQDEKTGLEPLEPKAKPKDVTDLSKD
ncbi:hypothetical protein ABL840_09155 [Variovorax sp. NFACC27]|uniref:hypothetical protein n=1 Tax=unclassified Variovorax TaxID=663243 RepID=UPI00089433A8|nr:hypothetical protein SAMN03159371_05267 [Variovorax sp. NFACC28]SEG89679.1 hypothetical protein SAMN03159365_05180 [Variovorax sp. NFACC29]SFD40178.1 hypothetical protein SAMN03159379_05157 [Variovorax sp. NFACC26]SFG42467.1 hypothetical protein SAMN03159447_03267 [Variovorax sp. NFACC27]